MGCWNKDINGFVPHQNAEGTLPEYSDEQIAEIMQQVANGGMLTTGTDGRPVIMPKPTPTEEEIRANLRIQRESLLEAFDKWEKAVLRGREQDDYAVMEWYQDLLDLKESAFENVPERVNYYL